MQDKKRNLTKNSTAILYPWDQNFYSHILIKEKYNLEEDEIEEYYPVDHVVE